MTVDLVVLALVAVGAVFGARAGASRQLASWGALVLGALAARPGGALLGGAFGRFFHTSEALGSVAASFATFIVVAVGVRLVGTQLLQGVLGGSDPGERGTDRALGALLGGGKVAAVAWVALSALAFVEANVQLAGKGLGLSPKDSTAFAIARRWNLFSAPFFSKATDLVAVERVFRSPELFQHVAGNPAVTALEKNAHFRAVFADPEVKEALENGDTVALLRSASVHKLLQDPEALAQLAKLRQAVEQAQERGPTNPVAPRPTRVK
ncbi:MAG TPA: CvpA family protein [Myxococcaceae bacterium]|nr:CvpA family protein [Myxococcaceae bacterium]